MIFMAFAPGASICEWLLDRHFTARKDFIKQASALLSRFQEVEAVSGSQAPARQQFFRLSVINTRKALMKTLVSTLTLAIAILVAMSTALAQGNRYSRAVPRNLPPATEFIAARLHFGTNGYIGHMGWSHNYPDSDRNLNDFLERATGLDVQEASFRIVELGSEEVFDYPFAYVSEPGEMELTDQEVTNLREFISRGGFILMDDFDGPVQWGQMRSQVLRAFPETDFMPVDLDHVVFSVHTPLDNMQAMSQYVPGGNITYYGLFTNDGRLGILAGHNNDLANFWDWYEDGAMPLKPSTDAFRLGTNAVIYSLTH